MPIIDLTHEVGPGMPVYPGDPEIALSPIATVEKDGFNDWQLSTGMHGGTHIDCPGHFFEHAKSIGCFSLECFIGSGFIIDFNHQDIDAERLNRARPGDIVLFRSGHDKKFGTSAYFSNYPVISNEIAQHLLKTKIKAVGFDTPSPDRAPHTVHKMLLSGDIPLIENLCNLDKLPDQTPFTLYAVPLKIRADSSPARVFAVVPD